jgi:hypothetical protein
MTCITARSGVVRCWCPDADQGIAASRAGDHPGVGTNGGEVAVLAVPAMLFHGHVSRQ